jgi:uncharacterized protein YbjT (DUF2867 family)
MDNILDPKMGGSQTLPILAGSLASHVSFPMVATADIGTACVKILQSPAAHAGKHFDLIGDRLTVAEMRQVYARVTGRRAKWYRMPRWVMRWINKEFAEQLAWHNRVDLGVTRTSRPFRAAEGSFRPCFPGRERLHACSASR